MGTREKQIMEASKIKTLYLHIGASKTGTSSLQYFLLQNRDHLSSKGINYPTHEFDVNQFSSGNAKWIYHCLKRNDISKIKSYIDDIFNADHPSVILSSEYLYELGEEYVVKLKEILNHIDVKVIVYLRRQDCWLMSAYQQHIKKWFERSEVDIWSIKRHDSDRYWYKPVHLWARIFGKENVVVRPYEKQQFIGGNIFSDFLNILHLDLNDGFKVPQREVNVSYRTDALEAMRLLNFLPLSEVYRCQLRILLQCYSEHFGKKGDWPYPVLSPAEQLQCARHYTEGNQAIAREFLGRHNGQLFYDPLPSPDEPWEPYPGLDEENIRQIADFILRHDVITSIRIKNAVTMGLQSNETAVQAAAKSLSSGFLVYVGAHITLWNYIEYFVYRLLKILRRIKKTIITKRLKPDILL